MKILKTISVMFILVLWVTLANSQQNINAIAPLGGRVYHAFRAFPLEVDAATAKMAGAPSNADIIMAEAESSGGVPFAATVLQDIRIIDVIKAQDKHYLLAEVSPIEAQYLAIAAANKLKIILRAQGDIKIYPMEISVQPGNTGGAK